MLWLVAAWPRANFASGDSGAVRRPFLAKRFSLNTVAIQRRRARVDFATTRKLQEIPYALKFGIAARRRPLLHWFGGPPAAAHVRKIWPGVPPRAREDDLINYNAVTPRTPLRGARTRSVRPSPLPWTTTGGRRRRAAAEAPRGPRTFGRLRTRTRSPPFVRSTTRSCSPRSAAERSYQDTRRRGKRTALTEVFYSYKYQCECDTAGVAHWPATAWKSISRACLGTHRRFPSSTQDATR